MKILIVLLGAIGDVARGVVLVDQLKRNFPGATVGWLVEPKSEGVLRLTPAIDTVHVFKRGTKGALLPIIRELRTAKYDTVLDLQRHAKSGFFSFITGAKRRIGFHRRDAKEGNWLFSTERIPYRGEGESKVDHYLSFITQMGGEIKKPLSFGIVPQILSPERTAELANVSSQGFIAIALGSSWRSKNWPIEGVEKLVGLLLRNTPFGVVLLGGKEERENGERIKGSAGRVLNYAGATTLGEVAAVISRAKAGVGNDSGPGHIASALGIPFVSLFGPTDPQIY